MTADYTTTWGSPAVTDRRYKFFQRMTVPRPEPRGYPGNLGLLFAEHAESNRTAITDLRSPEQPRPLSFRELDAACDACARGLVRSGLQSGDRLGILSLNRLEFVVVLLGAMRAGVVPVPINVKRSEEHTSELQSRFDLVCRLLL